MQTNSEYLYTMQKMFARFESVFAFWNARKTEKFQKYIIVMMFKSHFTKVLNFFLSKSFPFLDISPRYLKKKRVLHSIDK